MRRVILLSLLVISLTGCVGEVMGAEWQAAEAEAQRARAAAEWARTTQAQAQAQVAVAEAAAATAQAPARAQATTIAIVATLLVGVGILAGLGASFVAWSWMRARLIFADKTGLYPVVVGQVPATSLNEPGAQHVRIAPGRANYQVLPPEEIDAVPLIPAPLELDARQLQHIERLLLPEPVGSLDHDDA